MMQIHKYASHTNTNTHGKTRNTQVKKYRHTQIQILPLALYSQIRGGGVLDLSSKSPLEKTAVTSVPE